MVAATITRSRATISETVSDEQSDLDRLLSAPVRSPLALDAASLASMSEVARAMSQARATIPKHLQGSPGDCLAVIFQAQQWGMNPFAVAQKTHIVNGTLGYEAQLVIAVLNSSPLLATRISYAWEGDWGTVNGKTDKDKSRACIVSATLRGESEPRTLRVSMAQVGDVRNSPLWASDPGQQLAYLATKRWGRLHAPDVMLGVYAVDDLQDAQPEQGRRVTQEPEAESAPPPAPPIDPAVTDGRRHLSAMFSTLGWDAADQKEWLSANYKDPGAACRDPAALADMAAKLEALAAVVAQPAAPAEPSETAPADAAADEEVPF